MRNFFVIYYMFKSHIIFSLQIIILLLFTPEIRLLSSFSLLSAAIWFPSGRYKGTILSNIILTVNLLCSVSHIARGAIREFTPTIIFYFLVEHVSSADLNGWPNAAPQASYIHKHRQWWSKALIFYTFLSRFILLIFLSLGQNVTNPFLFLGHPGMKASGKNVPS